MEMSCEELVAGQIRLLLMGFVQRVIHQLLLGMGHAAVPWENTQRCWALVQLSPTAADSYEAGAERAREHRHPEGRLKHEGAGGPGSPWGLQMTFMTELSYLLPCHTSSFSSSLDQ